MSISLRVVQPEDEPFLFRVYASTRQDELAQVPWDEAQREAFLRMQFQAQTQHYQAYFPQALHQVIQVEGRPVGRLYVDRQSDAIHILDITVLPAERGAGVGGAILRDLIEEARPQGKAVRFHVETFNPSLSFFERLGFAKVKETGIHYLLEWSAK